MTARDDFPRTLTVDLIAVIDLEEHEVWPDGAPDNWTIDDVKALMESQSKLTVLREWNLLDDIEVEITEDKDGNTARVWDS